MRTPKQHPSMKNKSKAALKVQAANTSFLEGKTSTINLPSKVPSTPQLRYGFKMATPVSAVKPTLREKKQASKLELPSNSKSERELRTPVLDVPDEDSNINTPVNNTSIVLIVNPIEEATPVRSRKSQAKNISVQRLITNDGGDEGSKTPTSISTPRSALKKSKIMAELLETSINSTRSTRSSVSPGIISVPTNLISPFQSKLNKSGILSRTPIKSSVKINEDNISSKRMKRKSTTNISDLPSKQVRLSRATPSTKKVEENILIACDQFKSPAPSTSKPKAKTEPRNKTNTIIRRSLQVNPSLKDNSIICGNSTLESADTSSFEYVSNRPQSKVTPSPKEKYGAQSDCSSDEGNSFICGDSTLRSIDTSSFLLIGNQGSPKKIAISTEKLLDTKSKKKSATPKSGSKQPEQNSPASADVHIANDSIATENTSKINKTDLNISGIDILENENDIFGKKVRTYSRSPVKKTQREETEQLETPEVPPNVIDWVSSLPRPVGRPLDSTKAKKSSALGKAGTTSLESIVRRGRSSQYSVSPSERFSKSLGYTNRKTVRATSLNKSNTTPQEHIKQITPIKSFTNDILTPIKNAPPSRSRGRPLRSTKVKLSPNKSLPLNLSPSHRGRPLGSTMKENFTPNRTLPLNLSARRRGRPIGVTKAKISPPPKQSASRKMGRAKAKNMKDDIFSLIKNASFNSSTTSSLPRARGRHLGSTKAKLTPNLLRPRGRSLGSTKAKLTPNKKLTASARSRGRPICTTKVSPKPESPSILGSSSQTPVKDVILTPIGALLPSRTISPRRRGQPTGTTKAKLSPPPKQSASRRVGRAMAKNMKDDILTRLIKNAPLNSSFPRARGPPLGSSKANLSLNLNTNSSLLRPRGRSLGSTKAKLTPNKKLTASPRPRGRPICTTKVKKFNLGRSSETPVKDVILTPIGALLPSSTISPRRQGRLTGTTKAKLSTAPKHFSAPGKGSRPEYVHSSQYNSRNPEITKKDYSKSAINPNKIFQKSTSEEQTNKITPAKRITFKDDILTPIRSVHSCPRGRPRGSTKAKISPILKHSSAGKVVGPTQVQAYRRGRTSQYSDGVPNRSKSLQAISPIKILQKGISQKQTPAKNITFKDDILTPIRNLPLHSSTPLPPKTKIKNEPSAESPNKNVAHESVTKVGGNISNVFRVASRKSVNNERLSKINESNIVRTRWSLQQTNVNFGKQNQKDSLMSKNNQSMQEVRMTRTNKNDNIIDDNLAIESSSTNKELNSSKFMSVKGRTSYRENKNDNIIDDNLPIESSSTNKKINDSKFISIKGRTSYTENYAIKSKLREKSDNLSFPTRNSLELETHNHQENSRGTRSVTIGKSKYPEEIETKSGADLKERIVRTVKKRRELDLLIEYNENIMQKQLVSRNRISSPSKQIAPAHALKGQDNNKTVETRKRNKIAKIPPSQKVDKSEVVDNKTGQMGTRSNTAKKTKRSELDILNEYNKNITQKKMDTRRQRSKSALKVLKDTVRVKLTRKSSKIGDNKNSAIPVKGEAQNKIGSGDVASKMKKRSLHSFKKSLDSLNEYNENVTLKKLATHKHKRKSGAPGVKTSLKVKQTGTTRNEATLNVKRTTRNNKLNEAKLPSGKLEQQEEENMSIKKVATKKSKKRNELDFLREYNENIMSKKLDTRDHKVSRGRNNTLIDAKKTSRKIEQNEIVVNTNKKKTANIRATRSKFKIDEAAEDSSQHLNTEIGRSEAGKSDDNKVPLKRSNRIKVKNNEISPLHTRSKRKLMGIKLEVSTVKRRKVII